MTLHYDETMDLDAYLATTQLLDCQGRVSHTLVVLPDGSVRISFANGRVARVDPRTGQNLTPKVPVDQGLVDTARSIAQQLG